MANTIAPYNPIFYAQEALIHLQKALGMAGRVHRGYDEERRAFGKGQTIQIRKPSVLTVANAPATAEDLSTESVTIDLNQWREVKFKLSDKELAYTGERIIEEHIQPAAYALADDVDQKLAALYKDVPWYYTLAASPGSTAVTDITGPRQIMFDNAVPLSDPSKLHLMVNGSVEAGFLNLEAFSQQQGAGDLGVNTQMRGSLGMKYGFEVFANQNVQTHVSGVASDAVGTIETETAVGDTSISVDAFEASGTVTAGDIIVITGDDQQYVATAAATATTGTIVIPISPAMKQVNTVGAVTTVVLANLNECLMFHRNAFALAMAPLSDMPKELGARVETITDPVTGLSIRARVYYVGNSSEVHVALDILYGVKTLDGNLAVRCQD